MISCFQWPKTFFQFQQFIYVQPTYIWTEILYGSAFRKLIVVMFKLRPNWNWSHCALIARVSNGLNLGMLFTMPPRVCVATRRSDVVHLPSHGHWHHLRSNHTQAPAFLQDRWCQGSSWVNELDLGLTHSVGPFTPMIGEYLSLCKGTMQALTSHLLLSCCPSKAYP